MSNDNSKNRNPQRFNDDKILYMPGVQAEDEAPTAQVYRGYAPPPQYQPQSAPHQDEPTGFRPVRFIPPEYQTQPPPYQGEPQPHVPTSATAANRTGNRTSKSKQNALVKAMRLNGYSDAEIVAALTKNRTGNVDQQNETAPAQPHRTSQSAPAQPQPQSALPPYYEEPALVGAPPTATIDNIRRWGGLAIAPGAVAIIR